MILDKLSTVAKIALSDIALFSRLVIQVPLYGYQLGPLQAVLDSIFEEEGREFLLVFPRQSGKNEAVAQLLVYLLNLLQRRGGNIVYGATGDGLGRGIQRLEKRLDNPWNRGRWRKRGRPVRRGLGKAAVVFLSTHPSAAARGETADWLLVIDEMQDQSADHLEAVFEPMRAAHMATGLYIGTVRSTDDALWRKKLALEKLTGQDGIQRVFVVSPEIVIDDNPSYGRFLEKKVRQLGRKHPIVASEYFNEPLRGQDLLFDGRRLALMLGEHGRRDPGNKIQIQKSSLILATLDVGGQDEAATSDLSRLANPGRDYTVAHIFEVEPPQEGEPGPIYRAIDVFVDQGSRHFQKIPGRASLAERLLNFFQLWDVAHLVADESGVGAGLVDWLGAKLGRDRVTGYAFSPRHKAELGADFLSLVETGRFKYWAYEDGEEMAQATHGPTSSEKDAEARPASYGRPLSDGWWFFQQAKACTYSLSPGGRFERDLRWSVADGRSIDTPAGRQPLHDDRLISAALVSAYDELIRQGKVRLGRAASAIIPPRDPLGDW